MARIRTIKPEFWTHEGLARVSRDARLLFVGLFNVADDEGRMRAAPRYLHGAVFPYDDDLDVSILLDELEEHGHIQRYTSEDGQSFLFIRGFLDHQKIDHASASKLPEPPRELLAKPSRKPREPLDKNLLGSGIRDQGREGRAVEPAAPVPATSPAHGPTTVAPPASSPLLAYLAAFFPAAKATTAHEQAWRDGCPGVDLLAEAKKANAWALSNPRKAPRKDVRRFLDSWFRRAAEDSRPTSPSLFAARRPPDEPTTARPPDADATKAALDARFAEVPKTTPEERRAKLEQLRKSLPGVAP